MNNHLKPIIYITKVSEVKEVSNVGKVSSDERVDGVEGDGEEGHSEGEAELDVLRAGGGHPEELVGCPGAGVSGVAGAGTLIPSKISLRHLPLLRAVILHGVTDAAGQEVGEELEINYITLDILILKGFWSNNYSSRGHV